MQPPHPETGRKPHRLFHFNVYTLSTTLYSTLLTLLSSKLICAILIFAVAAELEDPGFLPRPKELFNGFVCFLCAGCMMLGSYAVGIYIETLTWPWDAAGFVWPWERWFWSRTLWDNEDVDDEQSGVESSADGVEGGEWIVPPTPLLPRSMRGVGGDVERTSGQNHRSGLLGESPEPVRSFKHFSGNGFARMERKMRGLAKWENAGTSVAKKKKALAMLMEENSESDGEDVVM